MDMELTKMPGEKSHDTKGRSRACLGTLVAPSVQYETSYCPKSQAHSSLLDSRFKSSWSRNSKHVDHSTLDIHCFAMASPASLGSRALRASHRIPRSAIQTRGLAAAASGSFQYETGDASGVKYASRDLPGATTTLTVIAKAGTRYQPLPGYSDALEKFAFKVGAECLDPRTIPMRIKIRICADYVAVNR